MAGKPINLQDIEKLELNKIDKSQIKNTLTETEIGNVLDASQGKVLNDKISVLNVDRGYLSSKNITDANEAIQNGIYKIRYDCLNLPEASSGSIDVSIYDTSIIFQKLINANMNTWVRIRKSSVWTDWKQIATTTHITGLNDKINVLDGVGFKYNGNITTFSQINKTGYYTIFGCLDGTIPIQYGTLKAYLSGSEKTITAMGWYNNEIIQCFASYNNNTSKWTWQQLATTTKTDILDTLKNDWLVAPACNFSAQKIGNRMFIDGILYNKNVSPHTTVATGLPLPSDLKWHGGIGMGNNGKAMYFCVTPSGELLFQNTIPTQNTYYCVSVNYPVN